MAQRSRISTGLSGVAGEYFVAAELSRRGYIATLTLKNTKGIDILASNISATKTVAIQVKTNQKNGKEWMLNQKVEADLVGDLFFVFVRLNNLDTPEYHVVSRKQVAEFSRDNHQKWLNTPGKRGQQHNETSMRKFTDNDNTYLGKWDMLGLDD